MAAKEILYSDQARKMLECPHCSTRLLLLLDPRDRAALGQSEAEKRAADYFGTMIAAQHLTSHPLDRLTVPKQNCCN